MVFGKSYKNVSKNQELIRKINSPKEKPIIWDICLASINCKLGCHNASHMVCNEDLIKGSCDCLSKEEYDVELESKLEEIALLKKQLQPATSSSFQTVKLSKKKKIGIQRKINYLTNEIRNFQRKIHLTEQGLIPFEKQLSDYQQEQLDIKEKAEKKVCDRKATMKKVVKKKF